MSQIKYYNEDCTYKFEGKRKTSAWIESCATAEGRKTGEISIIFCSDAYLLEMNKTHLKHDYFTDIITFDYSEPDIISGDLFISVDTVRSNGAKFGTSARAEMLRVIIHGVLHLCGYGDKSPTEEKVMREKEDFYLARYEI